jgi:hypothetical protein
VAQRPVYQLPPEIAEFADRFQEPLNYVVSDRMRRVGVPEEMIGIDWYGIDQGAFVRYQPPQIGGNLRVDVRGRRGINVDAAVFDADAPKVGQLPSWRSASLKERIDAVIAHEHAEVTAPDGVDFHIHAVQTAENTPLRITDQARQILREYRQAEGY